MTIHENLLRLIRANKALVEMRAYNTLVDFSPRQIIYLEDELHESVNTYITSHYEELQKRFSLWGFEFVYLPSTTLTPEQMAYWDPSHQFNAPLSLRASMLYDVIKAKTLLGSLPAIVLNYLNDDDYHALCGLRIDDKDPHASFCHFFYLCDRSRSEEENIQKRRKSLFQSISGSLCSFICKNEERGKGHTEAEKYSKEEEHTEREETNEDYPSVCGSAPCLDITVEDFPACELDLPSVNYAEELPCTSEQIEPELTPDEQQLIHDIQRKLDLLRSHGLPESVLEKIFAPAVKPSRMRILKNGTIILPDYQHTVIEMIPLDKVLYLLLLRHPEGIFQKDLSDHIDEMKELYCRISGGFLPDRALAGILNLASPLSNSCNEKISRIRNVFQSHFQPAIAAFYTISGGRAGARRITLDPEMVEWE